MASRYQEVYRLNQKFYLDGSPVIIEAGALQNDLVKNKILAQIKIRNISSKNIIACKVAIWAYEINGSEVEGVPCFSYLDINVATGEDFGTKIPIYFPNNNTRRFSVAVLEVVYSDYSIWSSELVKWTSIPNQQKLMDKFQNLELVKQYETEIGGPCSFVPTINRGLFLCTCGAVNMESVESCYKCKRRPNIMLGSINEEYLNNKMEERLKSDESKRILDELAIKEAEREKLREEKLAEQKAKIEREENKKERRKTISGMIIILVVFVILAFWILKQLYLQPINYIDVKSKLSDMGYSFWEYDNLYSYEINYGEEGYYSLMMIRNDEYSISNFENYADEVESRDDIEIVDHQKFSNYEIYEYRYSDGGYILESRVGNTILYIAFSQGLEEEMIKLAKELGYYPKWK